MKKLRKYTVLFLIGAVGYALLETAWRGYTHWSMLLAGGVCFVLFSLINARWRLRPLLYKVLLCALAVTGVELVFGLIFNLWLGLDVWDYSALPFNFLGQICLIYTVLWGVLAWCFLPLAALVDRKL